MVSKTINIKTIETVLQVINYLNIKELGNCNQRIFMVIKIDSTTNSHVAGTRNKIVNSDQDAIWVIVTICKLFSK